MATTVNSIGSTKPIQVGFGGTGLQSTVANQLLYSSATNTIAGLATATNSVLATSAGGVPALTSTLPNAVQSNITQLGTVTSGTWNGSVITPPYGGTGVNNGSNTLTLNSNVTFQGSFPYVFAPTTGIVTITFPTSGVVETLPTITDNHQILSSKTGTAGWESRYFDNNSNLFVGTGAGNPPATGVNNTVIGVTAAPILTMGSQNTAIGAGTLGSENIGINNTAIGYHALVNQLNGNHNTAVGYQAGITVAGGGIGHCTLIGAKANVSSGSLVNATAIGYNAIVGQSNSIVLGSGANVGIGTSTPNTSAILDLTSTTGSLLVPRMTDVQRNTLTATGGMVIYDTTSSALQFYNGSTWVSAGSGGGGGGVPPITDDYQVLTSGTGTATWFGQYYDPNDATQSVYLGTGSGGAFGGHFNTAVGYDSLKSNSEDGLTAFGYRSLSMNSGGQGNSAFGLETLGINSTGNSNSAFGYHSMLYNLTGNNNSSFGFESLRNLGITGFFTSDHNSAFGASALKFQNQGQFCSAFGSQALMKAGGSLSSGNSAFGYNAGFTLAGGLGGNDITGNSLFGYQALAQGDHGTYNTVVGYDGLINQVTGDQNTAVGANTGSLNVSGSQLTLLGCNTNVGSGTLTNATAIGYNAIVSTDNSIVLGSGARVGIGTSSPNASAILDLFSTTGALLVPRMTDTERNALTAVAGMVLYDSTSSALQFYDGSTWVSASGGGGGLPTITANHQLLTTGTGSAVWESQFIDSGGLTNNISLGTGAGNDTISGGFNTSMGYNAGNALAGGNVNTCFGAGALTLLAGGSSNSAFGANALSSVVSTDHGSAFGYRAGLLVTGGSNSIFGSNSLSSETFGDKNSSFGYSSLSAQQGASENSAYGYQSGITVSTGSQCTFLGAGANVSVGTLTNATAIGYNAIVSTNNSIVLGSNARVGIGTSSPDASSILDLTSTTGALLLPRMDDTQRNALSATGGMVIYDTTTTDLQFYNGSTWISAGGGAGGVTDVNGTTNQIDVSSTTGSVTLSIPSTFTAPGYVEATTYLQLPASSSTGGGIKIGGSTVFHAYNNNVFISDNAGNFTMTGGANICIGSSAGKALTSGTGNVGLGNIALFNCEDGFNNTCLGVEAGFNLVGGGNNTLVGIAAGVAYNASESGNIIIGSQVSGVAGENGVLRISTGSGLSAAYIAGINGVSLSGSAVAVFVDPGTDQLGTIVSSRRYKDNISDMGSFSDPIYKLRPTTFTMKNDDRVIPGLIAEEVYEIMPELVILDKEGLPQTVKYHEIPVLLLNEIQKLKAEISELKLLLTSPNT